MRLKTGLLGIGKIARDQHIPALTANSRFELVACASRNAKVDGVANFHGSRHPCSRACRTWHCVSICTPPQAHFDAALTGAASRQTRDAGEAAHGDHAADRAAGRRSARVAAARCSRPGTRASPRVSMRRANGCARASCCRGKITWKEDVHHWHPGQRWIWEPGGFGVFDPGINALSVLTEVLADEVRRRARAAGISRRTSRRRSRRTWPCAPLPGVAIAAEFDFRQKGEQSWDIELTTTSGTLKLSRGGAGSRIDGKIVSLDEGLAGEYPRLYERFAVAVRGRRLRSRLAAVPAGGRRLPDRRTPHRRTTRDLGAMPFVRCLLLRSRLCLAAAAPCGDPHRPESRLVLSRGGGRRWRARQAGRRLCPQGMAAVDLPHTWNRTGSRLRIPGRGLVLPAPRPAQTTRRRHRAAQLWRRVLQVARLDQRRRSGSTTRAATARTPSTFRGTCASATSAWSSVDNRPGMYTIPGFGARGAPDAWYDWWAYGGLVRDVWINVHGPVRVANQFIRADDRWHESHGHRPVTTGDARSPARVTARLP